MRDTMVVRLGLVNYSFTGNIPVDWVCFFPLIQRTLTRWNWVFLMLRRKLGRNAISQGHSNLHSLELVYRCVGLLNLQPNVLRTRAGRWSVKHEAKRAVIWRFLSNSANKTNLPSDVSVPPLKLAITFLPLTLPKLNCSGMHSVEIGIMNSSRCKPYCSNILADFHPIFSFICEKCGLKHHSFSTYESWCVKPPSFMRGI